MHSVHTLCCLYVKYIAMCTVTSLFAQLMLCMCLKNSISLTVALHFLWYLKGHLYGSQTAETKYALLHPPEPTASRANARSAITVLTLDSPFLSKLVFCIDSRGDCSPPSWERLSNCFAWLNKPALSFFPVVSSIPWRQFNSLRLWNHASSGQVSSPASRGCGRREQLLPLLMPSQVRPRALGQVQVFRADQKAFFSKTCKNSHSILVSQVSYYVVLLIWSASCLVVHDTSITLQHTAGRRLKAALGVTSL